MNMKLKQFLLLSLSCLGAIAISVFTVFKIIKILEVFLRKFVFETTLYTIEFLFNSFLNSLI